MSQTVDHRGIRWEVRRSGQGALGPPWTISDAWANVLWRQEAFRAFDTSEPNVRYIVDQEFDGWVGRTEASARGEDDLSADWRGGAVAALVVLHDPRHDSLLRELVSQNETEVLREALQQLYMHTGLAARDYRRLLEIYDAPDDVFEDPEESGNGYLLEALLDLDRKVAVENLINGLRRESVLSEFIAEGMHRSPTCLVLVRAAASLQDADDFLRRVVVEEEAYMCDITRRNAGVMSSGFREFASALPAPLLPRLLHHLGNSTGSERRDWASRVGDHIRVIRSVAEFRPNAPAVMAP